MNLIFLFVAKVLDNGLSTAKTILIQKNKCLLAGLFVSISSYLYFSIIKDVVAAEDNMAMIVVSIASGIGCCLAVMIGNYFSKDHNYVNVVMSDNKMAMQLFRDYLAEHHITNVATDCYTRDWDRKTITVTAYADTRNKSRMIEKYLENSDLKFKRVTY